VGRGQRGSRTKTKAVYGLRAVRHHAPPCSEAALRKHGRSRSRGRCVAGHHTSTHLLLFQTGYAHHAVMHHHQPCESIRVHGWVLRVDAVTSMQWHIMHIKTQLPRQVPSTAVQGWALAEGNTRCKLAHCSICGAELVHREPQAEVSGSVTKSIPLPTHRHLSRRGGCDPLLCGISISPKGVHAIHSSADTRASFPNNVIHSSAKQNPLPRGRMQSSPPLRKHVCSRGGPFRQPPWCCWMRRELREERPQGPPCQTGKTGRKKSSPPPSTQAPCSGGGKCASCQAL
jgi:hypothetical protein